MLREDEITIITQQGLNEIRQHIPCWACQCYGTYATNLNNLKNNPLNDNIIYQH